MFKIECIEFFEVEKRRELDAVLGDSDYKWWYERECRWRDGTLRLLNGQGCKPIEIQTDFAAKNAVVIRHGPGVLFLLVCHAESRTFESRGRVHIVKCFDNLSEVQKQLKRFLQSLECRMRQKRFGVSRETP